LQLNEEDKRRLTYALVSDLVLPKLGEQAREYLQPPSHLAKVLYYWRRQAKLRVSELAKALIAAGFPVGDSDDGAEVVDAEDFEAYLLLIEGGSRWPLSPNLCQIFLDVSGKVIGPRAKRKLAEAMDDDLKDNMRLDDLTDAIDEIDER
jgi:hypothetical protein